MRSLAFTSVTQRLVSSKETRIFRILFFGSLARVLPSHLLPSWVLESVELILEALLCQCVQQKGFPYASISGEVMKEIESCACLLNNDITAIRIILDFLNFCNKAPSVALTT